MLSALGQCLRHIVELLASQAFIHITLTSMPAR
nr:MAG TPA: hypothetical protein [Caudoviricetes sp.]